MTKAVKIGIGVAVLIALVAILYWLFKKPADAVKDKLSSGNYGTYTDTISDYNGFYSAVVSNFGTIAWSGNINGAEAKARGFFKCYNIAPTVANINTFKTEIQQYINDSNTKPHWEVTTGSCLNK